MDKKEIKNKPISKKKVEIARQCQYDQMVKNRNEDAYRRFKAKPYQIFCHNQSSMKDDKKEMEDTYGNALALAKLLHDSYVVKRFKEPIDQAKMHKFMYLLQRESLICTKKIMFNEEFLGWRYGPLLLSVRSEYMTGSVFALVAETVSDESKKLVNDVLDRYGELPSWKLSSLLHNEFSWKSARKELNPSENGNIKLSVSAMKVDAARELGERKKLKID